MTRAPETAEIRTERRGAVEWVILNRPHAMNALTFAMYERLGEICAAITEDPGVRAVVFTGAPEGDRPAFAAGADIAQFRSFASDQDVLDYQALNYRVAHAVEELKVPTIAAIAGPCVGGGAILAAACDLRLAAPSARFGIPVARTLGNCLSMDDFTRLYALLGLARTKELVLTARLLRAQEMLDWGVVGELTVEDGLAARAQELAEQISRNAPLTMWATKQAMLRIRGGSAPEEAGDDLMLACFRSEDFQEGVQAFLEKRRPEWRGR